MDKRIIRKRELEKWLTHDYILRLGTISRCEFLGIVPPERKYDLIKEAHEKDQEYRALVGLEPLPDPVDFIKI